MENKIVQIDVLKLEYDYQKICKCERCLYEIDVQNRLIRCTECGAIVDPFEALMNIAKNFDRVNEQVKNCYHKINELNSYKPYLREAKRYEAMMREKDLLPICPKCGELFEWHELRSMGNKIFYKKEVRENEYRNT